MLLQRTVAALRERADRAAHGLWLATWAAYQHYGAIPGAPIRGHHWGYVWVAVLSGAALGEPALEWDSPTPPRLPPLGDRPATAAEAERFRAGHFNDGPDPPPWAGPFRAADEVPPPRGTTGEGQLVAQGTSSWAPAEVGDPLGEDDATPADLEAYLTSPECARWEALSASGTPRGDGPPGAHPLGEARSRDRDEESDGDTSERPWTHRLGDGTWEELPCIGVSGVPRELGGALDSSTPVL